MTKAEYLRSLRAKAKAAGLCGECRMRRPDAGRVTCRVCLDKHSERIKAYVATGLCGCGREPRPGLAWCEPCAERNARNDRESRIQRIADGRCARCGRLPPVSDRKHCQGCLDLLRDRRLAGGRLLGSVPRPCGECGVPGHNRTTCVRYHERSKAWT